MTSRKSGQFDQIVVDTEWPCRAGGAADTVYNTPASEFVADFLGTSNRLIPSPP
ncbi:MAG: hypothetical protein R3E89_05010 [Thiolinea sp.]